MKNNMLKYITFGFVGLMAAACNDSVDDLLEPKVFFNSKEVLIEVPAEGNELEQDLQARLSMFVAHDVEVEYELLGEEAVAQYNKKNGTEYEAVKAADVNLSDTKSVIATGDCYAGVRKVTVKNISAMTEGKSYVLPVRIKSASLPLISGGETMFFVFHKPVRIMRVCQFRASYSTNAIQPAFEAGRKFNSVTYEALIYPTSLNDNHTVMGVEGTLILRIGDAGGGKPANMLQVAGKMEFAQPEPYIATGKWSHVAFTYDRGTGQAVMYVNGVKVSESSSSEGDFNFGNPDLAFYIGAVYGFMWGDRPFRGYMSEVRLWTVARTANQIKQNMLSVDPATDGLCFYYKLNGDDMVSDNGWKIKDASPNNIDGLGKGPALTVVDLDQPVAIN